jgi:hypothetical protein
LQPEAAPDLLLPQTAIYPSCAFGEIGERSGNKAAANGCLFFSEPRRKENAPVVVSATDWGAYAAHVGSGRSGSARQTCNTMPPRTYRDRDISAMAETPRASWRVGAKAGSRRCSNSNAHCEHQNDPDAGDQNGQRRPIIFEPSPILTELTHDNRPLLRAILFLGQWLASGMALALVSRASRAEGSNFVALRGRF